MLEGTLPLPQRGSDELVPGVVLFHGSVAQSRDSPLAGQRMQQFGVAVLVFDEIAEHLQDVGDAVGRYDKRTCGSWGSCDNDYPLPSADLLASYFVDDATSAMAAVAAHEATAGGTSPLRSWMPSKMSSRGSCLSRSSGSRSGRLYHRVAFDDVFASLAHLRPRGSAHLQPWASRDSAPSG
jgi:hypothetical protein